MNDDLAIKLRERMKECDELREELNDAQSLCDRLAKLLDGVCGALKGEAPPNTAHSWHDLPELTQALMADSVTLHAALANVVDAFIYSYQFEPDKLKKAQSDASLRAGMALGQHRNIVEHLKLSGGTNGA
jgi:hypothetical protein